MSFRSLNEDRVRFAAKTALRERLKRIRRALPRDAAATRDERIQKHCLSLIEGGERGFVGSYLPIRGEISTQVLHEVLLEKGFSISLPTIEENATNVLCWRAFDTSTKLVQHPLGFDMPDRDAVQIDAQTLRWVVIPCLAVDECGFRLGWGGGYYDRALDSLPNATRIALAYDFQVMAELPRTANDKAVDWIVTSHGALRTKSR